MSNPAGLTLDEAIERIEAGWHVDPGYIELLERDYDSAQRKHYLRSEHERIVSLWRAGMGSASPNSAHERRMAAGTGSA